MIRRGLPPGYFPVIIKSVHLYLSCSRELNSLSQSWIKQEVLYGLFTLCYWKLDFWKKEQKTSWRRHWALQSIAFFFLYVIRFFDGLVTKKRYLWLLGNVLITCVMRHWLLWTLYCGKESAKNAPIFCTIILALFCLSMVFLRSGDAVSMKRKKNPHVWSFEKKKRKEILTSRNCEYTSRYWPDLPKYENNEKNCSKAVFGSTFCNTLALLMILQQILWLSGVEWSLVWCVLLVRLFLEHVLQWMQVYKK